MEIKEKNQALIYYSSALKSREPLKTPSNKKKTNIFASVSGVFHPNDCFCAGMIHSLVGFLFDVICCKFQMGAYSRLIVRAHLKNCIFFSYRFYQQFLLLSEGPSDPTGRGPDRTSSSWRLRSVTRPQLLFWPTNYQMLAKCLQLFILQAPRLFLTSFCCHHWKSARFIFDPMMSRWG